MVLKKILVLPFLFFSILLFSEEKKDIVGVYNISPRNVDVDSADTITDIIRSEITKTGKFEVLDRGNMDKVLQEQNFQTSGITDPGEAVKAGKILNADIMAYGSFSKLGNAYIISLQMVSVETGKVIYSENEKFMSIEDSDIAVKKIVQRITSQKVEGSEKIYTTAVTGRKDVDEIISELKNKHLISYDKRSKFEVIGYVYDYDEILEDYYVFMIFRKIDIPTKKMQIKAVSNHLVGITFSHPSTDKAAKKAFEAGVPYMEQAKIFNASEGDPRRFEYRVYQKNGKPVGVEIYIVTRNADWSARKAKSLKYEFRKGEQ